MNRASSSRCEFGATDIVTERGDEGVAAIKELTDGLGAHSVIEAVGTQESMMQAIRSTRAGGHVGYVGVDSRGRAPGHGAVLLPRAPARRSRPGPPVPARPDRPGLERARSSPGKVFDLELPLDEAAAGYQAMDERRAIKVLLRP